MQANNSGLPRHWIFVVPFLFIFLLAACGHPRWTGLKPTDGEPGTRALLSEGGVLVSVSGKLTKADELFRDRFVDRYALNLSDLESDAGIRVLLRSHGFLPYLYIVDAETGKVLAESEGVSTEKEPTRHYSPGGPGATDCCDPWPEPTRNVHILVSSAKAKKASGFYYLTLCSGWVGNINDSGPESLRHAIANARPIGAICFDRNVFDAGVGSPEDRTITLETEIVIDKNLAVDGPGTNAVTVSGGDSNRVFVIAEGAEVYLSGLSIRDGNANSDAGGAICNYGALELVDSDVSGSTAADGGGICNEGLLKLRNTNVFDNHASNRGGGVFNVVGWVYLENAGDIMANSATDGGGIYNNEGLIDVSDSRVDANQATNGGGVYNRRGNLFVQGDTVISGNTASQKGGGIYIEGGAGLVGLAFINHRSTITSNNSPLGGGVYNDGGGLIVDYNGRYHPELQVGAIHANNADNGGGIYNNDSGRINIRTNHIIHENDASQDGGGVYNHGELILEQSSSITHNKAHNGGGIYNQSSGQVTVRDSGSVTDNTAGSPSGGGSGGGVYNNGQLTGANQQNVKNNYPNDIVP